MTEERSSLRDAVARNQATVVLTLSFLVLWELVVRGLHIPHYLLPAPSAVVVRMVHDWSYLATNTLPTFVAIVAGFVLSVATGFLLAVMMVYERKLNEAVFPILVSFQVIPKVALAPLFLVWFGFGLAPKVLIAALIAFFPIVVNTMKGLRSVELEMVQWMQSLGAHQWTIFKKLLLPSALPYMFAAFKISIGLATVGAVTGEFIGAEHGLGYVILFASVNLDTTLLFGALVAVSLLGVLLFLAIVALERLTLAWQASLELPPETM